MKLSRQEAALLQKLQDKAESPDTAPSTRTLNVSIDLGDDAQVARAQKLGLLAGLDDDTDDDDNSDDDDDSSSTDEDTPRRRGYFKD